MDAASPSHVARTRTPGRHAGASTHRDDARRVPPRAATREEPSTAAYRLDRRETPREPIGGTVMAAFGDEREGVRLSQVELVDRSHRGMGLRANVAISPGTRVALYPQWSSVSSLAGTVVRCEACGERFSIGIRHDLRQAA